MDILGKNLKENSDYISNVRDEISLFWKIIQYLKDFYEVIRKTNCNIIYNDVKEIYKLLTRYFFEYIFIFIILSLILFYINSFSLLYLQIYSIFWILIVIILLFVILFVMIKISYFISKKFNIKPLRHAIFMYFLILSIILWIDDLFVIIHKTIIFNFELIFLKEIYEPFLEFIIFYVLIIVILRIRCPKEFKKLMEYLMRDLNNIQRKGVKIFRQNNLKLKRYRRIKM